MKLLRSSRILGLINYLRIESAAVAECVMKTIGVTLLILGPLAAGKFLVPTQKPMTVAPNLKMVATLGVPEAERQQVMMSYSKLPLSFEANQGQTDAQVKFLSRGRGCGVYLMSSEVVLFLTEETGKRKHKNDITKGASVGQEDNTATVLRLKLLGANPSLVMSGLEELERRTNYFIGGDSSRWRINIPTYAKVKYKGVYPGIDLIYYGNHRQLEYDYVVAPGVDPAPIKFSIEGAQKIKLDARGDLVLETRAGEIRLHKPIVYQGEEEQQPGRSSQSGRGLIANSKQIIDGRYILTGTHSVGFRVGAYDASKPLIIDPVLSYSTYLGGSDLDEGNAIAVDSLGNAYITGSTISTNFPTKNPLQASFHGRQDAFVAKFNPATSGAASLLYSTYLGSSNGNAFGLGIAVDSAGNAYVTGGTGSTNFPTTPGAFQTTAGSPGDAFVTKLDPTGSALVYSTYLGGSGSNDQGLGIAVDSAGNACVTGFTDSPNFPTTPSAFQKIQAGSLDSFVIELNPAGSTLVYSTYLGGSGNEQATSIAVDAAGNIYVTGHTGSGDFPTTPGAFQTSLSGVGDAFVAKINPLASGPASLTYSTYLGGNANDEAFGIAADATGSAYVTGFTFSTNFPITSSAFQKTLNGVNNVFVSKLNATGSALTFSTLLGGSGMDQGSAIAVDSAGNVDVTGQTDSANFPVTLDALRKVESPSDAFFTKLNAGGSALLFSTYFGGTTNLNRVNGVAVDSAGNAYVTGSTRSTDFPTMNAFQPMCASCLPIISSAADAFVSKISFAAPGTADFSLSASPSSSTVAAGQSTSFGVTVTPSNNFNQMVTLTCSDPAAASSCSISPASVTVDGVNASTATATVTTTASSMLVPRVRLFPPMMNVWVEIWILFLVAFMVLVRLTPGGRRGWVTMCAAVLLGMFSIACGSSGGGGGGGRPRTVPGSYIITLTGTSGNLSHTTTVTLVVN